MSVTVTIDTRELARAIVDYARFSRRAMVDIINTKAFYILRGAARNTYRANPDVISKSLGAGADIYKTITRGKNKGQQKKVGFLVEKKSMAEAIVRSRIYSSGGKQPTKAEAEPMVRKFINQRRQHTAFIASGWIAGIKVFQFAAKNKGGAPPRDPEASKIRTSRTSRILGSGTVATDKKLKAIFWNQALAIKSKTGPSALSQHASQGLQQAINDEVASTIRETRNREMQAASNMVSTRRI